MPPPYSAGSVFLQVVPSFAGVQEEIGRFARKAGEEYGRKFDEGFAAQTKDGLGKAVDEGLKSAEDHAAKAGARAGKAYSEKLGQEAGRDVAQIGKALARTERESERAGQRAGKRYGGKFAETVRRALSQAQSQIDAIKVDADVDPALAALGTIKAAVAALRDAEIGVDLDASEAVASIAALEGLLDVVQRNAESIQVRVDAAQAMTELATVRAMVEQLDKLSISADIKPDRQIGSFESLLKSKIAAALKDLPPVDLQADPSDVNQKIAAIRAELYALGDEEINITVSADDALTRLRVLVRELEELDRESADVRVRADAAAAYRELSAVFGVVEALEADDVELNVRADTAAARAEMRSVHREGLDAASAFRAFNARVLGFAAIGPIAIPILGAMAAGLLAVGTAALAGVAALGVLALATFGVGDAVKALGDVERNSAKDQLQARRTMRSAANGVRDAEIGLMRARENAAESTESAGRRVEAALRGQRNAEEQLIDAQEDALRAQRDLIRAREEAQDQLEDLQLRVRGGALAERQAALDLAQAQATYIATFADGSATKIEREQVAIALERETIGYEEAKLANRRLQEQKAEADRTGVEGTDTYQRALERVAGANEAVENAQQGVIDAQRGVADAQRDAARATQDASRSIEDATRRLTDAQIAYGEALYDTQVIGSSSAQALDEAWSKLGPAGREFALFIHGLRDDFRALRIEAQEGFLPGLQSGIASFMDSTGPELLAFVGVTSAALGDLAARAGAAFASDEWQNFFDLMTQYTPIFLDQFGTIFGNIIEGFRNIAVASFGFTEEFGGGLIDLTQRWAEWTAGFSDPNSGFQRFLTWVREVGPGVLDFFGNLIGAVRQIAIALAPFAEILMGALSGVFEFISQMDPDLLGAITVAILGLIVSFQLATGAVSFLTTASKLLFLGGFGAIILGVGLVVTALVLLWTYSETFREIVTGAWNAIMAAVSFVVDWFMQSALPVLQSIWDGIAAGASWLWDNILKPIFEVWQVVWGVLWGFLVAMWDNVGRPMFDMIVDIAETLWLVIGPILELIGLAFQGLWELVKLAWEYVGKPIFDAFIAIAKFLWEYVIGPVLNQIAELFGWLFGIIESVWNTVGKPIFTFFGEVVSGLVEIFQGSFDGIKGIWEALLDVLMIPIVFVVETVLNKGLIAGINWVAGIFTDDDQWIDPIPTDWIPGRAFGGPIPVMDGGRIPGSSPHKRADNIPVWATAGEYMHDVDAVNFWGLDFMEDINARRMPRMFAEEPLRRAEGGPIYRQLFDIVKGQFPRARLNSGPRNTNDLHGAGMAVDLGETGTTGGAGRPYLAAMNRFIYDSFRRGTAELIYDGLGDDRPDVRNGQNHVYSEATRREHTNHVHWGARDMAELLGGGIAKGALHGEQSIWGKIADFLSSPIGFLRNVVTSWAGDLTKTSIGGMLLNIPFDFAEGVVETLLGFVGLGPNNTAVKFLGDTETGSGDVVAAVQAAAAPRGWGQGSSEWGALTTLIQKESSWNPLAQNPTSTAFGLFQFLNSTWAGTGFSKTGDPRMQAEAGMRYIASRYGTPSAALAFHRAHNWYADGGLVLGSAGQDAPGGEVAAALYDDGGYLPPGLSLVLNATGAPEPVLTSAELEMLRAGADERGAGGDIWDVDINETGVDGEEIVGKLMHKVRVIKRGGKYARAGAS